jgi:hypothetical protein
VLSKAQGEVIAEVPSNPSDDLYLAVPAGDYKVVRRVLGDVREKSFALAPGSVVSVDPGAMAEVAQSNDRSKGPELLLRSKLGAYVGVSTSVVPGSPSYLGMLALSYAYDFRRVAVRARASVASFDTQQDMYRSSLLRAGANLDFLVSLVRRPQWRIELGPSAGMPYVRQRNEQTLQISQSFGFAYSAVAVLSVRLQEHTFLSLNLEGGGEMFKLDGLRGNKPLGSALLGGVVAF